MTLILSIIIISYTLIAFEAIVPGGLLGILGFLGLIVAAYYSFLEFGGWFAPSLTFLLSGLGALALVLIELLSLSILPLLMHCRYPCIVVINALPLSMLSS